MTTRYPESTTFHSEVRMLTSSYTEQDCQIYPWLPPNYSYSRKSYPVLNLFCKTPKISTRTKLTQYCAHQDSNLEPLGYESLSYSATKQG
jgi:hypothetical protein